MLRVGDNCHLSDVNSTLEALSNALKVTREEGGFIGFGRSSEPEYYACATAYAARVTRG